MQRTYDVLFEILNFVLFRYVVYRMFTFFLWFVVSFCVYVLFVVFSFTFVQYTYMCDLYLHMYICDLYLHMYILYVCQVCALFAFFQGAGAN